MVSDGGVVLPLGVFVLAAVALREPRRVGVGARDLAR